MNSAQLIFYLIGACVLLLAIAVFAKPLRFILGVLVKGVLGAAVMYIVNWALGTVYVGVNALTFLTVGLLGVPGFIALYIIGIFTGI
jgi:inhibitor of the pro-sigma K processing machinery